VPGQRDPRLFPSRFHSRYMVLTRLRKALKYTFSKYVEGRGIGTVLDVGAGDAPYRPLLEPLVDRYATADLSGMGSDFEILEDGRVLLDDGAVDFVLSSQVLEHVEDPLSHLAELFRLLTPGGTIVLSTHGYWMYHPTPTEYTRWTGPGLRSLMERAGFHILETVGVLGRAASGLQLVHDGLAARIPALLHPLIAVALQAGMAVAELLDPTERVDDACVFVVAASKPVAEDR